MSQKEVGTKKGIETGERIFSRKNLLPSIGTIAVLLVSCAAVGGYCVLQQNTKNERNNAIEQIESSLEKEGLLGEHALIPLNVVMGEISDKVKGCLYYYKKTYT